MTTIHDLKCDAVFFDAVESYQMTFAVRKLDRPYQVGDMVKLNRGRYDRKTREFTPDDSTFPPMVRTINYILTADAFPVGLQPGYGVLGFASDYGTTAGECTPEAPDTAKANAFIRGDQWPPSVIDSCRRANGAALWEKLREKGFVYGRRFEDMPDGIQTTLVEIAAALRSPPPPINRLPAMNIGGLH